MNTFLKTKTTGLGLICIIATAALVSPAIAGPVESDDPTKITSSPNGTLPGQSPLGFPFDNATDISVTADLVWLAGTDAQFYDLYFGTDPTPDSSEYQGAVFDLEYDLPLLDGDTSYYWRVDSRNSAGTTTGIVWSFTTEHVPGPDVVASSFFSSTDLDYAQGDSIAVFSWTDNTGDLTASGVTVDYYISTNDFISTSDTLIRSVGLGDIAPGASTVIDSGFADIPWTLAPGNYYLGCIVSDSAGADIDTGNNSAVNDSSTTILLAAPDLEMVALSYSTIDYAPGGTVLFSTNILNNGADTVTGMKIDYYASTNSTISGSDRLMGSYIPGGILPAGFSITLNRSVVIPADLSWGNYFFGAIVSDVGVTDSDPTNNALAGAQVGVVGDAPDMEAIQCDYDAGASYGVGGTVSVETQVKNIGELGASEHIYEFYASTNSTITDFDTLIYTYDSGVSLNPGGSMYVTPAVSLPIGLPQGDYYIGYIVSEGSGTEYYLSNNAISGDLPITVGAQVFPDMRAEECDPLSGTSVNAGDTTYVFHKTANDGEGLVTDVQIDMYISTNSTITATDTFVGSGTYDRIPPGVSKFGQIPATIPLDQPSGDYYVGFIVSEPNGLDSDLSNHWIAGVDLITVTGLCNADLNADGSLDFFDVSAFLSLFSAQDPLADWNGDGSWDFFDVSGFLTSFGAGCP